MNLYKRNSNFYININLCFKVVFYCGMNIVLHFIWKALKERFNQLFSIQLLIIGRLLVKMFLPTLMVDLSNIKADHQFGIVIVICFWFNLISGKHFDILFYMCDRKIIISYKLTTCLLHKA